MTEGRPRTAGPRSGLVGTAGVDEALRLAVLKLAQLGLKDAVRTATTAGVLANTAQPANAYPAPDRLDIDPHPGCDFLHRQHLVLAIHADQCSASHIRPYQCSTMRLAVVPCRYMRSAEERAKDVIRTRAWRLANPERYRDLQRRLREQSKEKYASIKSQMG